MMFLEPQPRKPCDLNDGDFCLAVSDVTLKHLEKEPRVNYKLGRVLSSFRLLFGYFQQTSWFVCFFFSGKYRVHLRLDSIVFA